MQLSKIRQSVSLLNRVSVNDDDGQQKRVESASSMLDRSNIIFCGGYMKICNAANPPFALCKNNKKGNAPDLLT